MGRKLAPGARLGPYRLLALLGEGGMGRVFSAQHEWLGKHVALKTLRPELTHDARSVEHMVVETRAANLVRHPHVVQVMDFVRDESGAVYSVMERLVGRDLKALQAHEGPVPLERGLRIMSQLSDALAAVHRIGMVHRDVKPENVFVTRCRRNQDFVKLLDFGVAQLRGTPLTSYRDRTPSILTGTPAYMAPEQAAAEAVDHRTDIYAVGVILFELVTGTLPFEAATLRDLLVDVVTSSPPVPSKLASLPHAIAADLDDLILQCLEKEPSDRPQDIQQVGRSLRRLLVDLATPPR